MLSEPLSTNLTSLNEDQDRIAVVADVVIEADGSLAASDLHPVRVQNHGKLTYRSVAAWLDGNGPAPQGRSGEVPRPFPGLWSS
jgi:exoribonuclease R